MCASLQVMPLVLPEAAWVPAADVAEVSGDCMLVFVVALQEEMAVEEAQTRLGWEHGVSLQTLFPLVSPVVQDLVDGTEFDLPIALLFSQVARLPDAG